MGAGCIKCILNTVNAFWAIFSILVIALAALIMEAGPSIIIYLMFAIGGIGLVASILGCCGICQENICMTSFYAVFILLSLIAQLCSIFMATDAATVRIFADEDISEYWEEEIVDPGAMDFAQRLFKCCGKDSPNDYLVLNRTYPESCYPHGFINQTTLYTTGCTIKAEESYVHMVNNVQTGSWFFVAFTIVMLLFAIYLIMRFRKKQRHFNY